MVPGSVVTSGSPGTAENHLLCLQKDARTETADQEPVGIVLEPAEQSPPKLFPDVTGADHCVPATGAFPKKNMFLYPASPNCGGASNPNSPQVHSNHTTPRNSSAWSNISMSEIIDADQTKHGLGASVTRKSVGTLTRDSGAQTPVAAPGHGGNLDVSALIGTAAKNIEKASEILAETPQRDKRTQALVDQGTSFSPQGGRECLLL